MAERGLRKSTLRRWINAINATGSSRAADNRTPEESRLIELERENRRLKYPISAQCEILGVPRSACCSMRGRRDKPKQPDPLTPEVFLAYGSNRGAYGARKIKAVLERRGFCASRRRIGRIMKESGLVGAYAKAEFKAHVGNPNEADLPNIVAREFDGHAPHTHVVSDLTYVRVGGRWNYVCLLVDLHNREIVGHAAGEHKGTKLVKSAFAHGLVPPDRHRRLPHGQRRRIRQRGRRVDEQDPEGRVRLQGALLDALRAAAEAERLRPLVQPFQAALEAWPHEPGRVQEGWPQSLKKVSK